jgi:signal transduction histidine kinase
LLGSVVGRLVTVTAVSAAAIGATLGLFFAANTKLEAANRENRSAVTVSAAAYELRARVIDLDNAFQFAVHTGKPRFADRWKSAERRWRRAASQLEQAARGNASEERQARQLTNLIASYVDEYGLPVLAIAHVSPAAALSPDSTAEGSRRIDNIVRDTDGLAQDAAADAARKSAAASRLARRANEAGLVALVLTPLLLIGAGIWLARTVGAPLQRVVQAASSVAAGDFAVRLSERRRDEFGALGRAFNAMTESLAESRAELVSRADRLERAERNKTELISMVSHEVRTPLSSILGFTRLLLERDVGDEDRRRYLQIIDSEATRLAALVTDFLDARLIEDGQFVLRPEPLDVRSVVLEQSEFGVVHQARHRLKLELSDEPLLLDADRLRLTQVVSNLLSNAVKYSPSGGTITVGAKRVNGAARIWVEDEGAGIAAEHQSQIFEPFFRGGAPSAGIPGTGLGLAVSRRIVEAHGGSIGFDALAHGTRFWVELPVSET